MCCDHTCSPTSPDTTSLYVESKNFTFPLSHNVAIRLPSGDHAAARLASLILRTLRIERSNQSRPGNIPDPYSQVGGRHELLPIRRPRQEVHRAVHVGRLLEDRALPGLAHVPKNHRGFPAACDGQKGAVGGPGQAGYSVGRRGRRADDEGALRDVPDANHALRAPHRNIRAVGRPCERREIKLGIHQRNAEFSGGRIEEADDAVMAARGIQLVIRAELTGRTAAAVAARGTCFERPRPQALDSRGLENQGRRIQRRTRFQVPGFRVGFEVQRHGFCRHDRFGGNRGLLSRLVRQN